MRDTLDYGAIGSNLGRQLMQGAGAYENAQTKMGQILAQQGAQQAQADLSSAKASEIRNRAQFLTPEYGQKIAQVLSGLDDSQAAAINANQNGLGWAEEQPRDFVGPPQTTDKAPSWLTPQKLDKYNTARAMAMAGITGEHGIDGEKLAKAITSLTGTTMSQDRALAGGFSPQQMLNFNTFNAADKGKMFDQGAHGVMDVRTGGFVDPALFNAAVEENKAKAIAQRASAGNSAASAELHRAQAVNERANVGGGGKPPPGYRWKQDGSMEPIPGGPADLKMNPPKRIQDANDAVAILEMAAPIIDKATGSYAGVAIDQAARVVGKTTPGAEAAAQLRALEGALMMKQPRMEGPQSDKDVMLYRQMAGQIGDPTVPAAQKHASMQVIRQLHEKYADSAAARSPAAAQTASNSQDKMTVLRDARAAISAGADRSAVVKRLKEMGIKEAGL